VFGEVGLVGELRGVPQSARRLKEAARHGFRRVITPPGAAPDPLPGVTVTAAATVREVLTALRLGPGSADRG
jgi:DNA repair protein RadA/Sms